MTWADILILPALGAALGIVWVKLSNSTRARRADYKRRLAEK